MIVPDLIKAVESGWEKSRLEGLKIQGKHRMNERIREVWIKAAREDSDPDNWDTQEQFIERFAELIVKECSLVADRARAEDMEWNIGEIIKEHFGVEE